MGGIGGMGMRRHLGQAPVPLDLRSAGRILGLVCSMALLAGCETGAMLVRGEAETTGLKPAAATVEPATTGAASPAVAVDDAGAVAATRLTGASPVDPVSVGKRHFREGHFGLAEQSFRKAVELGPRDAEAWVGLAASYDRLRRFDLADRAYAQAIRLAGANPVILNNQGYSYLLRGDLVRARAKLAQARDKDAGNPVIAANLAALDESMKLGKDIR